MEWTGLLLWGATPRKAEVLLSSLLSWNPNLRTEGRVAVVTWWVSSMGGQDAKSCSEYSPVFSVAGTITEQTPASRLVLWFLASTQDMTHTHTHTYTDLYILMWICSPTGTHKVTGSWQKRWQRLGKRTSHCCMLMYNCIFKTESIYITCGH